MVLNGRAQSAVIDVEQKTSRLMQASFDSKGTKIHIINQHAPQSGVSPLQKQKHWRQLEDLTQKITKKQCTLVIGDTNARLHRHMSEVEKAIIGPHCFQPSR